MPSLRYRIQSTLFSIVEAIPFLAKIANRWAINRVVKRARNRPHPLSTVGNYVSWRGLTDRRWSGRHLPPQHRSGLPDVADLLPLFERRVGVQRLCPKSTCLFPAFAQYLTDGFLRTETDGLIPEGEDPELRLRRNTSNHEIDLCTLYGRTFGQTMALRESSDEKGRRGRLKSQMIEGEEYPPFLFKNGAIDPDFAALDPALGHEDLPPEQQATLFAVGGDRVNSVPQVAMLNTLFLREHNRLAGEIEAANPAWDDTRIFETARNTMIVLFIKMVVEDYINHISPLPFSLKADPSVAWEASWNKPNWITTEFSLLYRWHALIPDSIRWGGEDVPIARTLRNNAPLLKGGLLAAFADICATPAAELGPRNTSAPLVKVEEASILQDRACELASFWDYNVYLKQEPPRTFEDISSDPEVAAELARLYRSPEQVDFFVGLFCEDRVPNSPLPNLVLVFVALDAFSQALTNPLLSRHVFNEATFSAPGWRAINETHSIRDILDRNVPGGAGETFVSMTRADWQSE
ncbi:peroxidase family protein [Vannielia litorea]|uniref:peroxidase family protein n=1 Tax=Vannielia litorea TaxID=1217970 RepID=UPI001C94428F|nr:peroxidase family protein [Vannielia litorea]MBY6048967.1 heme peroxidase [Vannielia litorea]MBY6076381.1 heme peroxidase [Vannielia litorea]